MRTVQANQIRGLLAEYGIVSPQELGQIAERLLQIREDGENGLPRMIRQLLERLGMSSKRWTNKLGPGIAVQALAIDATRESCKLEDVAAIGPITASAFVASMRDRKSDQPCWA